MKKKFLNTVAVFMPLLFLANNHVEGSSFVKKEQVRPVENFYLDSSQEEKAFLEAMDTTTGWEFAYELSQIGSSNKGWGFRGGGTKAGKMASDMVYDKFEELGLDPQYYEFPVYAWDYYDSSFQITEKPEVEIPTVSAPGTKSSEGITGELVFIGTGSKQDLEGVDLTGKIAVMALDMDYINWYGQAGKQAELHNAAALIYYCANYYGQQEDGEAFSIADWSGPEIDIPVLNTPKKYGEMLKDMLEKETLSATLTSDVKIDENATGYNVIGTIEGSKYPDEYVIINGHTDSFFYGFLDDSLAVGTMIDIIEAINKSEYVPERTLVFIGFDAEEFGAVDLGTDWLLGSWNLLKGKEREWSGKTVGCITLELMAYRGTEKLEMRSSDMLYNFVNSVAEDMDTKAFEDTYVHNYVSTWSDEFSFSYFGIPTLRTHTDPNITENFYHSQFDTVEVADVDKYRECLYIYGQLFIKMDRALIAPYDMSHTAKRYLDELDQDILNSLGLGDSLMKSVKNYQELADEINEKSQLIYNLIDREMRKGNDTSHLNDLLAEYNRGLMTSAKTIIMNTQYLNGENISFNLPYYQNLSVTLDKGIDALKSGDASKAISSLDLGGKYYGEFLDYENWYKTYQDGIVLDNPDRNILWAEGKKLKYYDHYHMFESLREKADTEDTQFTDEIELLGQFKKDALTRVNAAYIKDKEAFEKASQELPLETGDKIIDILQ